jgi:hypothetical protein
MSGAGEGAEKWSCRGTSFVIGRGAHYKSAPRESDRIQSPCAAAKQTAASEGTAMFPATISFSSRHSTAYNRLDTQESETYSVQGCHSDEREWDEGVPQHQCTPAGRGG